MKNIFINTITFLFFLVSCSGDKLIKTSQVFNENECNENKCKPIKSKPQIKKVAILLLNGNKENSDLLQNLFKTMVQYSEKNKLFKLPQKNLAANISYPYSNSFRLPLWRIHIYESICKLLKSNYLLMGRIYKRSGKEVIKVKLFSLRLKKIIYKVKVSLNNNTTDEEAAKKILHGVVRFFNKAIPRIVNLNISRGNHYDKIILTWKKKGCCSYYNIFRSNKRLGPYSKIGTIHTSKYVDKDIKQGLRYWYKIYAVYKNIRSDAALSYGYRKPPSPKGLTLNEIIHNRDKPWPKPANEKESKKEKLWVPFWNNYYVNYIKLTTILSISKSYVKNGSLFAFRNFDAYSLKHKSSTLYLKNHTKFYIKLYSKKLIEFLNKFQAHGVRREKALEHIIKNGIAFCLRAGEMPVISKDGLTRYYPLFKALGLSTEYHRGYKDWEKNTIFFITNDRWLKSKLRKVLTQN
ncbi:hypothetical protein ACFL20_05630 [Spirochaetota bacterium]